MTDQPDNIEHLDWEPDVDLDRLPHLIDAVVDLLPAADGAMWRARFAARPGLRMLPADKDGWLGVTHQAHLVMLLHVDSLVASSDTARAIVVVDGQAKELVVERQGDT